MQGRVSSLQAALSRAEADADRLSGLLAAAEAATAAAKGREEAARAAGREYAERARRAETLLEEAEADTAEVRRERYWGGGAPEPLAHAGGQVYAVVLRDGRGVWHRRVVILARCPTRALLQRAEHSTVVFWSSGSA